MMFIPIIKYTTWNMLLHTELSNTSRSNNGYFRKQEIESVSCIQHIHTKRKLETLEKKQILFLFSTFIF